jgi:hypothetical protein
VQAEKSSKERFFYLQIATPAQVIAIASGIGWA